MVFCECLIFLDQCDTQDGKYLLPTGGWFSLLDKKYKCSKLAADACQIFCNCDWKMRAHVFGGPYSLAWPCHSSQSIQKASYIQPQRSLIQYTNVPRFFSTFHIYWSIPEKSTSEDGKPKFIHKEANTNECGLTRRIHLAAIGKYW